MERRVAVLRSLDPTSDKERGEEKGEREREFVPDLGDGAVVAGSARPSAKHGRERSRSTLSRAEERWP